jgi:hypothetical protein
MFDKGIDFASPYAFCNWILELFQQWGILFMFNGKCRCLITVEFPFYFRWSDLKAIDFDRPLLFIGHHWVKGKHRPVASHWQTSSHNVVSSTPHWAGFELTISVVIGIYYIGSCWSTYHTITTTTAPLHKYYTSLIVLWTTHKSSYFFFIGNFFFVINIFIFFWCQRRWINLSTKQKRNFL